MAISNSFCFSFSHSETASETEPSFPPKLPQRDPQGRSPRRSLLTTTTSIALHTSGHPPTRARHAYGRDNLHRLGDAVHAAWPASQSSAPKETTGEKPGGGSMGEERGRGRRRVTREFNRRGEARRGRWGRGESAASAGVDAAVDGEGDAGAVGPGEGAPPAPGATWGRGPGNGDVENFSGFLRSKIVQNTR
jgi:hypothetical protein